MAEAKPAPNERLRHERLRHGWSQQDLADKIGTTPVNVGRWERGITAPGPYLRQKLCELYDKSLEELGLVSEPVNAEKAPITIESNVPPVSPSQSVPASLWNVPYNRNLLFTGREDILAHLHDILMNNEQQLAQPQAISGLGGIGKTQTAVEYAYRYRDSYQSVLWARADSADLLTSDFLLLAALLDLPQRNEQDQNVVVKAVLRWFDTHEDWLLILDNADHLEAISGFIPPAGKGYVLLTTRANSTGTIAGRIELDKMEMEEGIILLLRRAKLLKGSNFSIQALPGAIREQAQVIVEAVDGLPLALDQAGAYIDETGCTLGDYLKFYKSRHTRLLRMRGASATGHPEPVATTWSLSFEKVEHAHPAAAELLRLCAFLHPDEIPEAMIIAGASELGPLLQPVAEDELDWNEAIGELRKYSLVKRDPEAKILNIHRLVQVVIRDGMEKETERTWAERTLLIVNRAFPEDVFSSWDACQRYLPHVQMCVSLIKHWHIDSPQAIALLSRAGYYLRRRAQYKEAIQLLQDVLAIRQRVAGPESLELANDLDNLAWVYLDTGRYQDAHPLFEQAYRLRKTVLGPDHLDTTQSLNALGELYREQGEFLQAQSLFQQALAIRTNILGYDHPLIGESSNNLALVYGDIGKYSEVEPLLQQALAIDEKFLGLEHPEVATDLNNIGWNYYRQGRYDLVEAPHLRALAIREHMLGLEHPHVAYSLNALGLLYRDQGRYTEAEALLQRALYIREQALGPEHEEVGQSLQNLGVLYYRLKRYAEAEPLLRHSLAIREQRGPENPLVAFSLNPLAILYCAQGRYSEAEPLLERAIAIREKALGPDNIDLSYSLEALAVLSTHQGRYAKADALFQRALTIQETVLGSQHLYVAQTTFERASLYYYQENYAEAELLFRQALSIQEKSTLAMHPDVKAALANYASLLRKLHREAEAVAVEERIRGSRAE